MSDFHRNPFSSAHSRNDSTGSNQQAMDLAAYLARIGYDGPHAATHAVLAEVVLRHTLSIPFENIDAFLGQRVSLDPGVVARKLVTSGRGGWCFEQNLLLGNALRALGFEVIDLAARVMWGRPAGVATARTHRLLHVRGGGQEWLADVGFGGQTLTGVLRMDTEDEQATPHELFRLRRMGDERVLESLVCHEWLALCSFGMQPQLPIDSRRPTTSWRMTRRRCSHSSWWYRGRRGRGGRCCAAMNWRFMPWMAARVARCYLIRRHACGATGGVRN